MFIKRKENTKFYIKNMEDEYILKPNRESIIATGEPVLGKLYHEKCLIPFRLKGTIFSFEKKSLFEIFDIDLDDDGETFITEADLFASPLAQNPQFRTWYFSEANSTLQKFLFQLKKIWKKQSIQNAKRSIRQLREELKRKNVRKELWEKYIEPYNPLSFGTFMEEEIPFLIGNYIWFEISKLCEVFHKNLDAFESEIKYCSRIYDGKKYISELEIFSTSMIDDKDLMNWYEKYILNFPVNRDFGTEENYCEMLNKEIFHLKEICQNQNE